MTTDRGRYRVAALAAALVLVTLLGVLRAAPALAAGPCGPPVVSVIACENSKPGDPESDWQITGAGDSTIQGYATSMSVNAGGTISFKINTPARSYHIDILRIGYYGGNGARKIVSGMLPTATLPQSQPACKIDATTGLIDCGNWAVSASWNVPSDAVSGLYIAHLVRDDTGGSSQIPFVVRNDASHSDILVQTSDETWEAYNDYGGNSLYTCSVSCPPGSPAAYKGAFKVSYNRPFDFAADSGRANPWYAEYPMIRFLEANGYDVSYTSGADVDANASLLLNHKMFISSGHDEYWAKQQRANVTAARDAGVNLAFFSGNEMFWKTRWENSTDGSNTPYRTLVTYKETHFDAPTDPKDPPTWTGTWEDPRFSPPADGGNPPNALTGQNFIINVGTADVVVPAQYAKLRIWRNTAVANLTGSQTVDLGNGAGTLGYEWDEDTDNGFRPAGLFDLSSTTVSNVQPFTDYGSTVGTGTDTHHLSLYRSSSGALVFGSGTVQWSWGLDSDNISGKAADRNMQQATVNLFADMGAQPTALMSGLTAASPSTDTAAPTSAITSPSGGANLQDGSTATVTGTASDAGGGVVAGVEVSTDSGATWHPATLTGPAATSVTWTYTWAAHGAPSTTIESRAVDDSGNLETPGPGVTVSIACPCSIWGNAIIPSTVDSGDAGAIEVGVKFRSDVFGTINGVRFYKASTNTGTHIANLWTASGQLLARATFSAETTSGWQQVTFATPVTINPNTTYIVSYYAPKGHYSQTDGYFYPPPSPPPHGGGIVDSPPLHALRNSGSTVNGVYSYGTSTTFPTSTFKAENYWVDPMFVPQPAPGQATAVQATAGYATATVSWTPPTSGGPATSYTVTPYIGSTPQTPTTVTGTPVPTSANVTGLTNGTTYTFTVTASNPAGSGPESAPSNAVAPSSTASAIANGGFESGLAGWAPGGLTPPIATTTKAHGGTTSALLGSLSGTEPLGDSTLSQTLTVPPGSSTLTFWYLPGTTDALCSGAGCTFDWQEAQLRSTSGATLASIFKSNSNSGAWTQVTFNTTPYAGQTVVLYFNVHEDGSNPPDDTWMYLDDVSLTAAGAPTVPGAPAGVSATAGNGSASVSWTAPSNGGSPITGYTITPYIGSTAQATTTITGNPPQSNTTITGLTNGTAYTFTVKATNAVGTGQESAQSNSVTPTTTATPAFVQQASNHSGSASTITVTPTSNITAGNRLVVLVGVWANSSPSASKVTDSAGNTYTEVQHFKASDKTELSVWTAPITAGGGTKPVITATPSAKADLGIAVLEYSGLSTVAGVGAVDQLAQKTGTTSSAGTVTSGATAATASGNELALGFYLDSGFGDTLTAGTGFTGRVNVSPTSDMEFLVEDAIVGPGATPNAGAGTGANTVWSMSTAVFNHS